MLKKTIAISRKDQLKKNIYNSMQQLLKPDSMHQKSFDQISLLLQCQEGLLIFINELSSHEVTTNTTHISNYIALFRAIDVDNIPIEYFETLITKIEANKELFVAEDCKQEIKGLKHFCLFLILSDQTDVANYILNLLHKSVLTYFLSDFELNLASTFDDKKDLNILFYGILENSNKIFNFCLENLPNLFFKSFSHDRIAYFGNATSIKKITIYEGMKAYHLAANLNQIDFIFDLFKHYTNYYFSDTNIPNKFFTDPTLPKNSLILHRSGKQKLIEFKLSLTKMSQIEHNSEPRNLYNSLLFSNVDNDTLTNLLKLPWTNNKHHDDFLKEKSNWTLSQFIDVAIKRMKFDTVNYILNHTDTRISEKQEEYLCKQLSELLDFKKVYNKFPPEFYNASFSRLYCSILKDYAINNTYFSFSWLITNCDYNFRPDLLLSLIKSFSNFFSSHQMHSEDAFNIHEFLYEKGGIQQCIDVGNALCTKFHQESLKHGNHELSLNTQQKKLMANKKNKSNLTDKKQLIQHLFSHNPSILNFFKSFLIGLQPELSNLDKIHNNYVKFIYVVSKWQQIAKTYTLHKKCKYINESKNHISRWNSIQKKWRTISLTIQSRPKINNIKIFNQHIKSTLVLQRFIKRFQALNVYKKQTFIITKLQSSIRRKQVQKTYNKHTFNLLKQLNAQRDIIQSQRELIEYEKSKNKHQSEYSSYLTKEKDYQDSISKLRTKHEDQSKSFIKLNKAHIQTNQLLKQCQNENISLKTKLSSLSDSEQKLEFSRDKSLFKVKQLTERVEQLNSDLLQQKRYSTYVLKSLYSEQLQMQHEDFNTQLIQSYQIKHEAFQKSFFHLAETIKHLPLPSFISATHTLFVDNQNIPFEGIFVTPPLTSFTSPHSVSFKLGGQVFAPHGLFSYKHNQKQHHQLYFLGNHISHLESTL